MRDRGGAARRCDRASARGGDQSLYAVDTDSVTATIKLGRAPDIASAAITGTIPVGAGPEGFEVDTSSRTAFVPNAGDGTVSVVDAQTRAVTETLGVPAGPQTVAADTSTGVAWVVNRDANSVSVIER